MSQSGHPDLEVGAISGEDCGFTFGSVKYE
jgi:hypothetical protein